MRFKELDKLKASIYMRGRRHTGKDRELEEHDLNRASGDPPADQVVSVLRNDLL